jgi:hypothetical protein
VAETEVACLAALPLRVLVVANRTAATPDLIAAVRRYAQQRPTTFALLIPDAPRAQHPDWTLEFALSLLDRAAGGRVTGLPSSHRDPVAAIQNALATHPYDRIILSTPRHRMSRWLRRDLPRRLESLGVPVEVIRPERERLTDITGPPLMSGCELWLQAQSGRLGRRRRLDPEQRSAAGGAGRG